MAWNWIDNWGNFLGNSHGLWTSIVRKRWSSYHLPCVCIAFGADCWRWADMSALGWWPCLGALGARVVASSHSSPVVRRPLERRHIFFVSLPRVWPSVRLESSSWRYVFQGSQRWHIRATRQRPSRNTYPRRHRSTWCRIFLVVENWLTTWVWSSRVQWSHRVILELVSHYDVAKNWPTIWWRSKWRECRFESYRTRAHVRTQCHILIANSCLFFVVIVDYSVIPIWWQCRKCDVISIISRHMIDNWFVRI